jgi:hypothetical protein
VWRDAPASPPQRSQDPDHRCPSVVVRTLCPFSERSQATPRDSGVGHDLMSRHAHPPEVTSAANGGAPIRGLSASVERLDSVSECLVNSRQSAACAEEYGGGFPSDAADPPTARL